MPSWPTPNPPPPLAARPPPPPSAASASALQWQDAPSASNSGSQSALNRTHSGDMPKRRRAATPQTSGTSPTQTAAFAVESADVRNALSSLVHAIEEDDADTVARMRDHVERIAQLEQDCQRLRSEHRSAAASLSSQHLMTVVGLARAGQSVHRQRLVGGLYSQLSTKQWPLAAERDCQDAAKKLEEESWWHDLVQQHMLFLDREPATDPLREGGADFSADEMAGPGADVLTHQRLVAQVLSKSGADASVLEADLRRVSVAMLTLIVDVLDYSAPCPLCP